MAPPSAAQSTTTCRDFTHCSVPLLRAVPAARQRGSECVCAVPGAAKFKTKPSLKQKAKQKAKLKDKLTSKPLKETERDTRSILTDPEQRERERRRRKEGREKP
jgi:hypothetical protein